MNKLQKCPLLIIVLTSASVALGIIFIVRRTDPVKFHLSRIQSLNWAFVGANPLTVKDYFKLTTWLRIRHGRPSFDEISKEVDKHREALIQLGYYTRREFTLTNPELDRVHPPGAKFHGMITNFSMPHDWSMRSGGSDPSVIVITSRSVDMPFWEGIVSRFNSNSPPIQ